MTVGALLTGMAGCTIVPPPPPPQPLLVAYPGAGKDPGLFQQDDAFCKTASASPPGPPPGAPVGTPPGAEPAPGTVPQLTPGQVYLRCMAARGNVIQPLPQAAPPPLYAYYAPYPVYGVYGGSYPWLYGDYFAFGFGFGGYRGYGFRDNYFRGGYGGFRDGGFRDGGFRDGGFRDGGGFRGGGFRR
jgi:hypothetical protein